MRISCVDRARKEHVMTPKFITYVKSKHLSSYYYGDFYHHVIRVASIVPTVEPIGWIAQISVTVRNTNDSWLFGIYFDQLESAEVAIKAELMRCGYRILSEREQNLL